MSIILSYPTLGSPTALVVLPDVEKLSASRPVRKRQNVFETDADAQVVYDFASSIRVFPMHLGPLSKQHADELQAFFDSQAPDGVNGRAGIFELQDSSGTVYKVSFAQDVMEPQQVGVSWYDVSLTLRVMP